MTKDYLDEILEEELQDPKFRKIHRQFEPRRALTNALIRLRKAANLSQAKLGKRTGWKQAYVARFEGITTTSLPTADRIEKYANACNFETVLAFVDSKTWLVKELIALSGESSAKERVAGLLGMYLPTPSERTVRRQRQIQPTKIGKMKVLKMGGFEIKKDISPIEQHIPLLNPRVLEEAVNPPLESVRAVYRIANVQRRESVN